MYSACFTDSYRWLRTPGNPASWRHLKKVSKIRVPVRGHTTLTASFFTKKFQVSKNNSAETSARSGSVLQSNNHSHRGRSNRSAQSISQAQLAQAAAKNRLN